MEIVENVLRHEGFQGELLDYGKQFYSVPGVYYCFWMTWRVGYQLREVWLGELSPTENHALEYPVIKGWIMQRVEKMTNSQE